MKPMRIQPIGFRGWRRSHDDAHACVDQDDGDDRARAEDRQLVDGAGQRYR